MRHTLNINTTRKNKSSKKTKSKVSRKSRSSKVSSNMIQKYGTYLPAGTLIYKQKKEQHFEIRNQFQWFSQIYNYSSESYGPFLATYQLKKKMLFFDLGKEQSRQFLMNMTNKYNLNNLNDDDICSEQISGMDTNLFFHKLIEKFLIKHGFNGTFVDAENDKLDCNVSEIVFLPITSYNHAKYITKIKSEVIIKEKKIKEVIIIE